MKYNVQYRKVPRYLKHRGKGTTGGQEGAAFGHISAVFIKAAPLPP